MRILAIDPGTTVSGVCLYETSTTGRGSVRLAISTALNVDVLRWLRAGCAGGDPEASWDHVAIERFVSHGTIGGDSVLTILWTGRFQEAARAGLCHCFLQPTGGKKRVTLVKRLAVLHHLGIKGNAKGKDGLVIDRCCDMFGGPPRRAAQGLSKSPGPLYGVAGHAWQALGIALTVAAYAGPMRDADADSGAAR